MFPPAPSVSAVSGLVSDSLTESVDLLGPTVDAEGTYGEAVPGARTVVASGVAASVNPETPAERLAADRAQTVQGYRVRVHATADAASLTGDGAVRWNRPASLGGALVLRLDGPPVGSRSGLFLDLTCTYSL